MKTIIAILACVLLGRSGHAADLLVAMNVRRCWWSGTGGIANYDGTANRVLVSADEVTTPTALAISPEGVLA